MRVGIPVLRELACGARLTLGSFSSRVFQLVINFVVTPRRHSARRGITVPESRSTKTANPAPVKAQIPV
jgi:hypothetical protein